MKVGALEEFIRLHAYTQAYTYTHIEEKRNKNTYIMSGKKSDLEECIPLILSQTKNSSQSRYKPVPNKQRQRFNSNTPSYLSDNDLDVHRTKIGPQRTSRKAQKLKLLPEESFTSRIKISEDNFNSDNNDDKNDEDNNEDEAVVETSDDSEDSEEEDFDVDINNKQKTRTTNVVGTSPDTEINDNNSSSDDEDNDGYTKSNSALLNSSIDKSSGNDNHNTSVNSSPTNVTTQKPETTKEAITNNTIESVKSPLSSSSSTTVITESQSSTALTATSKKGINDNINNTKAKVKVKRENKGYVYSQVNKITDKPARRDARRLGKAQRHLLPRCTAYCTASSYNMRGLIKWLRDSHKVYHTKPKLFDECLYTPFFYTDWRRDKRFEHEDIIRLDKKGGEINVSDKQPDLFIFEYGVVVLWGFTEREEKSLLNDIERFEKEKLAQEDIQVEEFNYYITTSYQPRIYNDFITLRDGSNYMTKLSISHAIAQSVKISLFEELVDNTIEDTQEIPQEIASTGKVSMNKEEIMKSIGELFILRININLHGSVMDSPEIMWSEPQLEPIYQATRGYLEINQRVALLNQRLEVISDLLQMLKEQLGHSHEEYLEFIVIILVGVEVFVSLVNIAVDILANR